MRAFLEITMGFKRLLLSDEELDHFGNPVRSGGSDR